MNNIYPTFEVGFLSELFLWSSKNQKVRLNFRWPIRQVIATDFREFDDAGIYSVPYLALSIMPQENTLGWGIEPSLAVMWGSQRYHQYFYGVPSVHARPDRPFYQGKRGFSGTQLSVVLSKRYKNLMFFPFIRYDILKGAVFEDSPLVRKKNYLLGGIGLAWLFISSKEKQSGQTVR